MYLDENMALVICITYGKLQKPIVHHRIEINNNVCELHVH